jgi:hypothetical protein
MSTVTINRAPVLTLWAAVVAERLGYDWEGALTLGRALAGMNAASKARTLGIARPSREDEAPKRARKPESGRPVAVELMGRTIPSVRTEDGVRALASGRPTKPESVERYLEGKFGDRLEATRAAMRKLAKAYSKEAIAMHGFALYEVFRPSVPRGGRGWGAKGVLDLDVIARLARDAKA